MKQTGYVAFLLTLLSLLLILVAAVVFLLQGRRALQDEVAGRQTEVANLNAEIAEIQTTAAARNMALATSQALQATQVRQVADLQEELAEQQTALAAIRETRAAEATAAAAQLPTVVIVRPERDENITAGGKLIVIVVARHPMGLAALQLQLGEESVSIPVDGNPFGIFRYEHDGPALESGRLLITALATSVAGTEAQDSVRIVVSPPPTPSRPPDDGQR